MADLDTSSWETFKFKLVLLGDASVRAGRGRYTVLVFACAYVRSRVWFESDAWMDMACVCRFSWAVYEQIIES